MYFGGKSVALLHGLVNSQRHDVRKSIGGAPAGGTLGGTADMQVLSFPRYVDGRGVPRSNDASFSRLARWFESWRLALVIACIALPLTTGCGSPVSRGTVLYQQQNYIEAAEAFERTQGRLVNMEPVERARYGLYRGLTFMALGDFRGAERWLEYAEALQRAQPGVLPEQERVLLARGRRELSLKIREAWPKPDHDITQGVAASTLARDATVTH